MTAIALAPQPVQEKIARAIHKWDKVGQDVSALSDPVEIAQKAGIDWEVNKYPILKPNGSQCENIRLLIREDTGDDLTVCSKEWKPLSNVEFVKRGQQIASRVDGRLIRAGFKRKGGGSKERLNLVWGLIQVGDRFMEEIDDLPESMRFSPYITINNCHNYGFGLNINAFFVRLICSNGMIQQDKVSKKFTHRADNLSSKSVDAFSRAIAAYLEEMNDLIATKMNEQQAYIWLASKYGKPNKPFQEQPLKFRMVWQIYRGEYDQDFAEFGINLGQRSPQTIDTAYGLLQTVIAYENHFGLGSLEGKLISLWREEAALELRKVQKELSAIALKRKQKNSQRQMVGF